MLRIQIQVYLKARGQKIVFNNQQRPQNTPAPHDYWKTQSMHRFFLYQKSYFKRVGSIVLYWHIVNTFIFNGMIISHCESTGWDSNLIYWGDLLTPATHHTCSHFSQINKVDFTTEFVSHQEQASKMKHNTSLISLIILISTNNHFTDSPRETCRLSIWRPSPAPGPTVAETQTGTLEQKSAFDFTFLEN